MQRIVIGYSGLWLSVKAMKRAKELGAAWATNEEIETTDELERRGGWMPDPVARDDPILIQVVEELSAEAAMDSGRELKIVEVPDGVEWQIEECEGYEWVAEKHRTWHA